MFHTDPMRFLERDPADVQLMIAVYEAAARDLEEVRRSDGR